MEIDLKIVATRRPDLLERTLASFLGLGLRDFTIASVTMNLDPALGTEADAQACRDLLLGHRPDAQILEPEVPAFGGAVKRLWEGAGDRPIFHLEDDWIALEALPLREVEEGFANGYGAMTPLSREHNWDRKDKDAIRWVRRRFLGFRAGKRRTGGNHFGTSPKFILGPLAARMGALMNPDMDPEKQMGPGPMFETVNSFRSRYITTARNKPIIEDIGRDWRDTRRIEKHVVDGKSTWTNADNDTIA